MKCWNCKGRHASVNEVKVCHGQSEEDQANAKAEQEAEARNERFWEEGTEAQQMMRAAEADEEERRMPSADEWAVWKDEAAHREREQERDAYRGKMERDDALANKALDRMSGTTVLDRPSDKQVQYAMDLLLDHEWPDTFDESDLRNMERRLVSNLISSLLLAPKINNRPASAAEFAVTAGRYALEDVNGNLEFYQVDKPNSGKSAGRTFVKLLIGAPGAFRNVLLRGTQRARIMKEIAADPREAMERFGKETRQCGRCHSPLTNKESRERGIGPICVQKLGW